MKICVMGLWHLGTVTAACLASIGHEVVGLDLEPGVVRHLQAGQPPIGEPGLEELVQQGLAAGHLHFTGHIADAVSQADVVWVTYDTPVDDDDGADVEFVVQRVERLFPYLEPRTLLLISSQVPVGTTRRLQEAYKEGYPDREVSFAYSPENLRLGAAIKAFSQPDRIVVGARHESDRKRIATLLAPVSNHIEWMSVESAEMTKHALNAFLATSIAFANEIASLCEQVGADAKDIERGLKTDVRIGPRAYLAPGAPFAGGTLARDIAFLTGLGMTANQPTILLSAVKGSNDAHKNWVRRKLVSLLGNLTEQTVAVWGLAYKSGTDTLRRSISVELCEWLAGQGALVHAHDPAIRALPEGLAKKLTLVDSPAAALQSAAALVISSDWRGYQSISAEFIVSIMRTPIVLDPDRFLFAALGTDPRIRYVTLGKGVTCPSVWKAAPR